VIEEYWKLEERPFSNTPDMHFLFPAEDFDEAKARLLYNIKELGGGLTLITGEIGSGKTFLAYAVKEELTKDKYPVALLINPMLSPTGFLKEILSHFGVEKIPGYRVKLMKILDDFLIDAHQDGKVGVVLIDEGQLLRKPVIEQIRILLNLETSKEKLIQIAIFGQPDIKKKLSKMPQVRQRINIKYNLGRMDKEEAVEYIKHRCKVAGAKNEIFTTGALDEIFKFSKGIPRVINNICQNALFVGWMKEVDKIDKEIIKDVVEELLEE